MQIGQLSNLIFPDFGSAPATAHPSKDAAVRTALLAPDAPSASTAVAPENNAQTRTPLPAGLVYSNTPQTPVTDTDADTARAAEQHRQALARSADAPTSLSVSKDGVLVSKPASSSSASEAFVHFAVTTMRQYAEEQERQKSVAKDAPTNGTAALIPRSMGDIQKLASRFKLFA